MPPIDNTEEFYIWLWAEILEVIVPVLTLLVLMVLSYFFARRWLLHILARIVERTTVTWDNTLQDRGVFQRIALLAPATIAFYGCYLFEGQELTGIVQRLVSAYVVAVVTSTLGAVVSALYDVYHNANRSEALAIKGYTQVAHLIIWLVGAIVIFGIVLDESPWALLSGLGAATAVLLLVFRDTLLSFVASIQIASNDTLRVGDWVSMPKYDADGDVIDIALHTVRIQNWDKSVTTIPTHRFLEESFRNWRGMYAAGGRRIKRALIIDQTSVRFLKTSDLNSLSTIDGLGPYFEQQQLIEDNASPSLKRGQATNLGAFRAYVETYLRSHPAIHNDMTFLVRQLAPSAEGLPIEVYVFSQDIKWVNYEAIQAEVFEHLLAALPHFDLKVYQHPSGLDVQTVLASSRMYNLAPS